MALAREQLALVLQVADKSARRALPRHRVARWLRTALTAPAQITVRVVGSDRVLQRAVHLHRALLAIKQR